MNIEPGKFYEIIFVEVDGTEFRCNDYYSFPDQNTCEVVTNGMADDHHTEVVEILARPAD